MGNAVSLGRAVILAGGESRRMGREKALLELGGDTLLGRLVVGLKRFFRSVAISVARGKASALRQGAVLSEGLWASVDCYEDVESQRGPLEGIRSSLSLMPEERAFFVTVDTPLISMPIVRQLWSEALAARGAMPRSAGRVQPGFAVYTEALVDEMESALERGQNSLHQIAHWKGIRVVDLPSPERQSDLWASGDLFRSVNTPEEYARLVADFQSGRIPKDPVVDE